MSRKPTFEEALQQKMSELPLPDENASWQKMSALLDEKEKRRTFLFFRNEKIAGAALLLCALLLWLAVCVQPEKAATKPVADKNETVDKVSKNTGSNQETRQQSNANMNERESITKSDSGAVLSSPETASEGHTSAPVSNSYLSKKKNITAVKDHEVSVRENPLTIRSNARKNIDDETQQMNHPALQKKEDDITGSKAGKQEEQASVTGSSATPVASANSISANTPDSAGNHGNTTISKTGLQQTDSASASQATAKTTINIKPRSTYFIDAGLGVKQQLPIDSQRFVTYHYNGSKSWLGDYIPFLYLRLEKDKRWFLQGEFHYAAPRLINGVYYRQQSKADYSHSTASTDRYYLQKVWYDEVPLSLNIYVRPSLSMGGGAMYSRLRGAAVQQTTSEYEVSSGQYNSRSGQMPWKGFTDSFLYQTNTSLLLQADYGFHKWSFGVRYLHDLHPYITYTLPDGSRRDKRNTSLEVMLRYRLYRSAKFRIGGL